MQETGFDRQSFVAQHAQSQKGAPSGHGPIILALLVLLVGTLGFGVYKFSEAGIWDRFQAGDSSNEVLARLEEIESRLARLEKQRRPIVTSSTPNSESQKGKDPSSRPLPPSLTSDSGSSSRDRTASKPPAQPDPALNSLRQQVSLVQSDVGANKQAWDAAADRLVDVIGELGEQRKELTEQQRDMDQWRALLDRERQPFRVNKRMGRVRFGPVWLRLLSTSTDKQLYTMRVFLDDKAIEIRERALYEPIQLHPTSSSIPMELIVSEIGKDEVSGYFASPNSMRKP